RPLYYGSGGLGPTSDIDPRRTLKSCGSSSSEYRRNTAPTRVTRGSLRTLNSRPLPSLVRSVRCRCAFGTIVRNLTIVNVRPSRPTRFSRGSVFYRQKRVGRDGRTFTMVKFRTMVPNAHRLRTDLTNEGNGLLFKVRKDPRVTRVGAVLRRYSLDELPQLFNVLRGSMSLVG